MRKVLVWAVGIVVGLGVAVFALQMLASETGEVVVLRVNAEDAESTTRLWVVEHDGDLWLRGSPQAGWRLRLASAPQAELERHGQRLACVAEPDPKLSERINDLMAEKYGWRDRVIETLVGSRDGAIPMRLRCHAATAAAAP